MKILFVLTYYRPHWTGLTQYAARLAEGLAGKGHQVEVLCSRHRPELPLREEINQVKVFRLPYLFKFLRSVIMPKFPWDLLKRVRKNEVVVVFLPLQEVLLVALIARVLGKRLYLVHNGDLTLPENCGVFCRLVEKVYCLTTNLAAGWSERIIVQTEDYSKQSPLLSKLRDKWAIILPLYEIFRPTAKEVEKFKEKNSLEGKILIGFSGRLVEEKGVRYLLEAIPLVVKAVPKAHFVFAGDYKIKYEKYWEEIENLVERNRNHTTLLGLLENQKEIFVFYKSLDVYVQPSRTDCFPSSLVEALLSGIPAVGTDIPGARWPVKGTGMGEIVEPKNPRALAGGILQVIKNREEYSGKYAAVEKIFDYQKTLKSYEKLFEAS